VAGGLLLGIRLRFHHHAPQQLPSGLAFHQQAADELGCNLLGGAGEERGREVLGGLGGYGSGFVIQKQHYLKRIITIQPKPEGEVLGYSNFHKPCNNKFAFCYIIRWEA